MAQGALPPLGGSPEQYEQQVAANPQFAAGSLKGIRELLSLTDPATTADLLTFLAEAGRARTRRLAAQGPPWSDAAVNEALSLCFVDPARFFGNDLDFQKLVLGHLPATVDPNTHVGFRLRLLHTLRQIPEIDGAAADPIAVGWHLGVRSAQDRRLPDAEQPLRPDDDGLSSVQAFAFSLPSSMFDPEECRHLLVSIRAAAPNARILALSDADSLLAFGATHTGIDVVRPWIPGLSPWLRDPMLVARSPQQDIVLLSRTFPQKNREADREAARQLISTAPAEWEANLGPVRWINKDFPFHGGQLLFTPGTAWISVHSLEQRILSILQVDHIDPAMLHQDDEWTAFVGAADQATKELAALTNLEVRMVHPWPSPPPGMNRESFVQALAGGNDIDLDTLMTLLPQKPNPTLIIGDTHRARDLGAQIPEEEWLAFGKEICSQLEATPLRNEIIASQARARPVSIQAFLDLVEAHFARLGFSIAKAPLLMIPTALVTNHPRLASNQPHAWFPLGYANVVIESDNAGPLPLRAHAFSNGLPYLDAIATKAYRDVACRLILHPPLMESLICEGGFRCATQQIRSHTD